MEEPRTHISCWVISMATRKASPKWQVKGRKIIWQRLSRKRTEKTQNTIWYNRTEHTCLAVAEYENRRNVGAKLPKAVKHPGCPLSCGPWELFKNANRGSGMRCSNVHFIFRLWRRAIWATKVRWLFLGHKVIGEPSLFSGLELKYQMSTSCSLFNY